MSKTVEDIGTLKINLLSQAQYDAEKAGGRLADDELYLTPSSGTGVSDVEVNGSSVVSGGVAEIELKTINQNSIVGSGNIDIQGGAGVFVAEYGVTPYADIRDAILDGQSVICLMQDEDLMITLALADYDFDYGLIDFSVLAQSMGNYVSVYSNDEWASAVFTIAPNDMASTSRAGLMSASDKTKLNGIASGAEVNVQSDWSQSDSTADDYIKNKPTIPTITDTYSGTSSSGMSGKAVKSAIDALDGTISGSAGAGKTLTAFSQTDGKVSATFGNISITKSQVSDFPTIPTVNDATLTIQKNGTTVNTFTANASSNVTANITVPTDTGDLTNGAGYITSSALPTKVSDLTNDAGYITGYTETDPTVPSWAKQVSKPSYTASEVGALPDTTPIPSKTSDLANDSGFITGVTSTSTPTASTISEFDSTAHMNSTDMTSQEVSDFVDSLNIQKVLATVETRTLLWTNPASTPETGFSAQTVSLDLSGFDEVEIYFKYRGTVGEGHDYFQKFVVGSGGIAWHTYSLITEGTKFVSCRNVTVANDGITFSVGRIGATNATTMTDVAYSMIPLKIYGIKYVQL